MGLLNGMTAKEALLACPGTLFDLMDLQKIKKKEAGEEVEELGD
jgi:hypothetical protein